MMKNKMSSIRDGESDVSDAMDEYYEQEVGRRSILGSKVG
jgi:hypothetical protein